MNPMRFDPVAEAILSSMLSDHVESPMMPTEDGMANTADKIVATCEEIKEMLLEKNIQYGDSALNPVRIFSQASTEEQLLVRLDDKLSRIARGDVDLETEDVLNDLIGYMIMLKVHRA